MSARPPYDRDAREGVITFDQARAAHGLPPAPPLPGHRSERGRRGTPSTTPASGIAAAPSLSARVKVRWLRWRLLDIDGRLQDAEHELAGFDSCGEYFTLTGREKRMLSRRIQELRSRRDELLERIVAVERGGHVGAPCEGRQLGGMLAERSAVGGTGGARLAEPHIVRAGRAWERT